MKHHLFILFVLFLSSNLFSQTREERIQSSEEQIKMLKEGVLLVRLQSRSKTIEVLEERGFPKKAKYYKDKREKENKELARAFGNFDFCKVYFFYGHQSKFLEEGKMDSVKLMDNNLNQVDLDLDTFFIAEVGDLPKSYELDTIENDKNKRFNKKQKDYKGGANLGFKCMYIRDQNFNVLDKPFPYYQRYHPLPLTELSDEEVIFKLNEKLKDYYESVK